MTNYRKTYNKKVREFCAEFCVDRNLAAAAMNVKPDAFSRLTGEKSMHVSRPFTKDDYIDFMRYIIIGYQERLTRMIKLLDEESK